MALRRVVQGAQGCAWLRMAAQGCAGKMVWRSRATIGPRDVLGSNGPATAGYSLHLQKSECERDASERVMWRLREAPQGYARPRALNVAVHCARELLT